MKHISILFIFLLWFVVFACTNNELWTESAVTTKLAEYVEFKVVKDCNLSGIIWRCRAVMTLALQLGICSYKKMLKVIY